MAVDDARPVGRNGEAAVTKPKHGCAERIYSSRGGWHDCSRTGVVQENGRWWCRQHAPSAKQAKRDAQDTKWGAELRARIEAEERAEALGKRAGADVRNVLHPVLRIPTEYVRISEAALDRLLREAGR
jgi:hypothetical protein